MRKVIKQRIVSGTILIALLFSQVIMPIHASAETILNWENPNSNNNPYKLSGPRITPQMLTSVVSCTGLQDKVAYKLVALNDTIQKELDKVVKKLEAEIKKALISKAKRKAQEEAEKELNRAVLELLAATNAGAGASILGVQVGEIIPTVVNVRKEDLAKIKTTKVEITSEQQKQLDREEKSRSDAAAKLKREEQTVRCLNGIAVALARNQLTSMTRYTMNWINTGFNGNPMYVRDVNSYMDSITREILERENALFKNPNNNFDYPYGRDYARSQVGAYRATQDPYSALRQDLTSYLSPGATPESFATDFSQGGWNGWLALTQHPQNNPLGFNLLASENLARKQNTATQNARDALNRNDGYLDQQRCIEYAKPDPDDDVTFYQNADGSPKCLKFETVTPGSTIKTKIDTYVNTPERQLELVRTMDDALNSLFASLLTKFQNQGLASLSSAGNPYTGLSDGLGSNALTDSAGNLIPPGGIGSTGANPGSGPDGSFDITKDLGNKYIQSIDSGSWDAATNTPQLLTGVGKKGQFYNVTNGGSSKISERVTYWARGDKAFFDGTSWKKGVPKYIVDTKGALQIEHDYTDVARQNSETLTKILPSIGKLDYCIPGPNTNWRINSEGAIDTYINSVSGSDIPPPPIPPGMIGTRLKEYETKIDSKYGPTSPMQNSLGAEYLPMSRAGLAITKDIDIYADRATTLNEEYVESLNLTAENLKSLNQIKNKVNVIIAAAQKRRDAKRTQAGLPKINAFCIDTEKVTYIVNGVLK